MATLKNRNVQVPNGFKYHQAETGWNAPAWASFDTIVKALMSHRQANPFLARKNKWATDYNGVAFDVDTYNAKICQSHGWFDFIIEASPDPPKWTPQPFEWSGAAGSVKRTTAGVKLVMDWLGGGMTAVAPDKAEARATVCVACPLNGDPNWIQKLDAVAAEGVKHLVELKNDLKLQTSHDAALHTCQACDCHLPLKVWAPIDVIRDNMNAETKARLDQKCWVLHEGN